MDFLVLLVDYRDFDIGDSVQCLRYYAGWADKIVGQVGAFAISLAYPLFNHGV